MASGGSILELRAVTASYGAVTALRAIDLSIERGEITCLIGSNGAGKTTTMATIMGLVRAKAGSITFDGVDITLHETSTIVRRGMTLVPENRLVFPDMSVVENILCGAFQRNDKAAIRSDFEAMFTYFPALANRRNQPAGSLSGGEQQMVAIARALMSRPKLLLMDEPSLGLAPRMAAEIFRTVDRLKREGVTIFLVEQNVTAALAVADRFYVLEHGRVIFHGTSAELQMNDLVAQTYLGLH
jgi:branched-chain amino acid transport system ATP-binding protein